MPYLHYEKRCDQAEIHKIIMNINRTAMQERKLRHRNDQSIEGRSTSSPVDSDDDHTSLGAFESVKPSSGPTTATKLGPFEKASRLLAGEEGQLKFLNAEAVLIQGYLYGKETLHVSILGAALFLDF